MWSYRNPVDVRFGPGSFSQLDRLIDGRTYALVTYGEPFFMALAAHLARSAGEPVLVIGTHFATPSAGHIVPDGRAWRLLTD